MNDTTLIERKSSIEKKSFRENTRSKKPTGHGAQKMGYPKKISKPSDRKDRLKISLLSTYPPRECGIATYTQDLESALASAFGKTVEIEMYPLESGTSNHNYDKNIPGVLNTDHALDFLKASFQMNADPDVDVVMVQHEFGLFCNNEPSFLEFLDHLNKPVIITFHTVLPNPSNKLRTLVRDISGSVERIVVMTNSSATILMEEYDISEDRLEIIPHGIHLVNYKAKGNLKNKYDLQGKTVLTTFGFLGPGKSIETTLDALPVIVAERPEVVFCIIGKTHPNLLEEQGEAYRESLIDRVAYLNLGNHVRFIDEFVPLNTLLEYLQLTDVYLFTSKDPNQAVSGTFMYALGCGCPIISTPIPHALEVLQNSAGALFDFGDSEQLAQMTIELLSEPEKLKRMRLNGLQNAAAAAWENSAIAHARLFNTVADQTVQFQYDWPPLNLKHAKKMTDHVGIIQFSKVNLPNIESGYTLDDNSRALIAFCQHYELTRDNSDLPYIKKYFNFIYSCFRHDCTFLNYVDKNVRFTDQNETTNLEDSSGRAIWSLGYLLSMVELLPEEYGHIEKRARFVFEEAASTMKNIRSPRAIAFMIKGLYYYNHFEKRDCVNELVRSFANRLANYFESASNVKWQWFETNLTYANSVLPEAMLRAYSMTLDARYRKIAKRSFDFLLSKIMVDGTIRVISNKNWLSKEDSFDTSFIGGEQPIDVAYTVLALRFFNKIFPNSNYNVMMEQAFSWFHGNNPLNQTLYNPCTGGCYDGLELHNVNLNQGAESAVSYLLARMAFPNFGKP